MQLNKKGFAHLILLIAAAALVGGGGTAAIASNSARPGDFLYGLDKTLENVRSVFTFGDEAKANMYAQQAEERKGEIQSLLNGNASEENLDQAVRNYGDAMDKAIEKAEKLDDEAKASVLGAVAEKSLVHQDNFLEMSETSDDQSSAVLENAFQTANQNFVQAGEQLSEAAMEQVMTKAQSQVRNMEQLLEQIQVKTQEKAGEDQGNQNPDAGSDNSGNDSSNQPEETGNTDPTQGSTENGSSSN